MLIFQTFSCHDVGGGTGSDHDDLFMSVDYSVSCSSARYNFAFWWAFVMVFIYPLGN